MQNVTDYECSSHILGARIKSTGELSYFMHFALFKRDRANQNLSSISIGVPSN